MKFCLLHKKTPFDWVHLFQSYEKYVSKDATVLEIGASTIGRTEDLSRYCYKLIGVELIPERKPKDFKNIKYLLGDWQNLSKFIQPESIDVIVSSSVIEHVPNDLKAINELHKVLKSGGVALLNTPNRKRLTRVIIEFFAGDRRFPHWEHGREYVERDILDLLKMSSFREFDIIPAILGIHGFPIYLYSESVPKPFRKWANIWEVHLFKE